MAFAATIAVVTDKTITPNKIALSFIFIVFS